MKNLFITIFLLINFNLFSQNYDIDLDKSKIKWIGKEITTSSHYGTLKFVEGEIKLQSEAVSGKVIVDMESLSVDDLTGGSKARLEGHLRSDDFFSVSSHKSSTIEVTSSKKNGDDFDVDGVLTIKGISHPISFVLSVDNKVATSKLTFDRSKYDVRFRSGTFFENLGDKLILDDIELEVELHLN
tara:strand:+ start:555 stop:1109 length:555 start_codon:yes stop_codon:yes gene_type:complete